MNNILDFAENDYNQCHYEKNYRVQVECDQDSLVITTRTNFQLSLSDGCCLVDVTYLYIMKAMQWLTVVPISNAGLFSPEKKKST